MPTYSDALSSYITQTFASEDETLERIRRGIAERGLPQISIKPEEGRFLQFLVSANQSKLALEIGTLGGYSGTWIARGLPDNGTLITLEKDEHHALVAREHFQLASVSEKVEVRTGVALELLPGLHNHSPFDFVFIDAEKERYPQYLEWAMEHLRPGGIVAAHNAFLHGEVINSKEESQRVRAMKAFNRHLASNPRIISTIFPAGDGLAIGVLKA